jgi:hypothetical protein
MTFAPSCICVKIQFFPKIKPITLKLNMLVKRSTSLGSNFMIMCTQVSTLLHELNCILILVINYHYLNVGHQIKSKVINVLICENIFPLKLTGAYNRHGNSVYSDTDYNFTIVCTNSIQAPSFLVCQVECYTSHLEVIKYTTLLSTIKCFFMLFYKHNEIQKYIAYGFSTFPAS